MCYDVFPSQAKGDFYHYLSDYQSRYVSKWKKVKLFVPQNCLDPPQKKITSEMALNSGGETQILGWVSTPIFQMTEAIDNYGAFWTTWHSPKPKTKVTGIHRLQHGMHPFSACIFQVLNSMIDQVNLLAAILYRVV